ncbi:HAD family hydrolase [bacterium]|nr:HAD family hydrolase [bacterium]
MLRAIAFDFDGVILESTGIKTQAFLELFRDYPEHQDAILKLHLSQAGISRFEKFKVIYRDFLQKPLSPAQLDALGDRFSAIVRHQILTCPFVPGARALLERAQLDCLLFVVSGTPEAELREIVEQRHLTAFFTSVEGSPRAKRDILQGILHAYQLQPSEVVMIGDAIADLEGAHAVGIPFIGRVPPGQVNPFPAAGPRAIVPDLQELARNWGGWAIA